MIHDRYGLRFELDAFLLDLNAANRAEGTMRFYRQKLIPLLGYLDQQGVRAPQELTATHIRRFMMTLRSTHSAGGCHAFWRAVRAFVRFLVREGVLERNPMAGLRAPKVDEEPLEPIGVDDLQAMLATCDKSEVGLRDRCLMLTLLDTGLRASEATALKVGDLDFGDGAIMVRHSKSRKPRIVFVGRQARRALLNYMRSRGNPNPEEALWLAYHTCGERGQLSYTGLRDIIRRRAKRAGIPAPTLHSFRRGFAIMMLRNGADVVTLSRMMGHGSLPVVMRYLKQERGDLERVHRSCSPADHLAKPFSQHRGP